MRLDSIMPTMRELACDLGIKSTNAVALLIVGLEQRGFVKRTPLLSRGITVLAAGYERLRRDQPPAPCCPTCKRPL